MNYYIYFLGLWFFARIVTSFVTFDMDQGRSQVSMSSTIFQIAMVLPLAGRILNWW